jgi:hypothetical protein
VTTTGVDFVILSIFVVAVVAIFAFPVNRRKNAIAIWSFFGTLAGVTLLAVPIEHQMTLDSSLVSKLSVIGAALAFVSSFTLASSLDRRLNRSSASIALIQLLTEWAPVVAVPMCLLLGQYYTQLVPTMQNKYQEWIWLPPLFILLAWHVILIAVGTDRFRRAVFAFWNLLAFAICWLTEQKGWP